MRKTEGAMGVTGQTEANKRREREASGKHADEVQLFLLNKLFRLLSTASSSSSSSSSFLDMASLDL